VTAEIVCIGLATADLVVELPHWPDPDGRLVVSGMHRSGGGPAATAAVAAARLGRRVAFVGAIGADPPGAAVRDGLLTEGVDVGLLLLLRPGGTPESVILLDAERATRSILHAPGATLDALPPAAGDAVAAADWVHVDHAGWPLVGDVDPGRLSVDAGNPIPELRLAGLGLYAPAEASLLERYPGRTLEAAVRAALDEGARVVVVTLGGEGALAASADGAWRVRPPEVEVRSTLGAGDVFHGALLASLVGGGSLPEALRAATLAAALSCRGIDGRSAIPTADELAARLPSAPEVEPILLDGTR
jgi:sugar/nucleoside kinase (ribokinase family)